MKSYGNSSSELKQFSLGGDVLQPVIAAAQHTVVYQLSSFSAGYVVAPLTSMMAPGVTLGSHFCSARLPVRAMYSPLLDFT